MKCSKNQADISFTWQAAKEETNEEITEMRLEVNRFKDIYNIEIDKESNYKTTQ